MNTTNIYVCGPTVYDDSHLGHARTYVTTDLIVRSMRLSGKNVKLHMNITDIDDKIINKAKDLNTDYKNISTKYETSFFKSMNKLGVEIPAVICRVSDVIPDIVKYIQKILDNGFAYISDSGSIYLNTNEYESAGYTKNICGMDYSGENNLIHDKINIQDFVLWKKRDRCETGFEAEFIVGDIKYEIYGRPGWHIECSTIINEIIGDNLNIHIGGIDLKFPHHNNEIIQANCYYHPKYLTREKNWCSDFLHIGHLNVMYRNDNGDYLSQKMSKSLKNFTTIDTALLNISSNQLRLMFMMHDWKKEMTYTDNSMLSAKDLDSYIKRFFDTTKNLLPNSNYNISIHEHEIFIEELKNNIMTNISNLNFFLFLQNVKQYIAKILAHQIHASFAQQNRIWLMSLMKNLGFDYGNTDYDNTSQIMDCVIENRLNLKSIINKHKNNMSKELIQELYKLLDTERNILYPSIGLKIEDIDQSKSQWLKI